MVRTISFVIASSLIALLIGVGPERADAQIVVPSTWASGITIEPTLRDAGGVPTNPPTAAVFDDWDSVPLAVTDDADNPSVLNIIDIKDVKVANDSEFVYIYVNGHKARTNGMYIAIDTDQDLATGFDIYGLGLVGSELGYVNDFPFDQRTAGVFNNNKPLPGDSCCTGGPLDINNGGAAMFPSWDVEFGEREWGIPLDAMWSVNEPFGPTIPNPSLNFILWTDQGLTDVTETISYTLATPPSVAGDYNGDSMVDAADYTIWRDTLGSSSDLRANGDNTGVSAGLIDEADYLAWKANYGAPGAGTIAAVPEPATLGIMMLAATILSMIRRR